jgi:hypothetical protein
VTPRIATRAWRRVPAWSAVVIAVTLAPIAFAAEVPEAWKTRAEHTAFRETGDYDDAIRFCRQLEKASPWVRLTFYGVSGQGRRLPMAILSKDQAFTPEQALRARKPVVLIQNGIHAGEIEGKDACLALMRDIAVSKTHAALLDHATVLVLPIFSVDAHERRSRYNRINQNGPDSMGWRSTPIGLNLNRDYLKVETPEMRALVSRVITRWQPHLLVDNHTTDGADYRYDLTYGLDVGPSVPAPVERWSRQAIEGRVMPRVETMGHLTAPYLEFKTAGDPRSGVEMGAAPPRFSTGYASIRCRPAILVETHMLKAYSTRVQATYDLMVALLEEVNARPRELMDAVTEAEAEVVRRGREVDAQKRSVVLRTRPTGVSEPLAYKGVVARNEWSEVAGGWVPRYTSAPWDTVIPLYREQQPTVTVTQPVGYLVPREWTLVAEKLQIHGVRTRRLARPWADTVEVQRIAAWSVGRPAEGHRPITVDRVELERRWRSFHPGDLWVPLDQPAALVAVHLLEAQAPDGLMYWNAFDTVLEPKEYAETYVMEPIARRMLQESPALAEEFRARLAADSSFATSPAARMDFFYRRSPWADPEQGLHPAARALRPVPEELLER